MAAQSKPAQARPGTELALAIHEGPDPRPAGRDDRRLKPPGSVPQLKDTTMAGTGPNAGFPSNPQVTGLYKMGVSEGIRTPDIQDHNVANEPIKQLL